VALHGIMGHDVAEAGHQLMSNIMMSNNITL
jgi:hypothetical protein